MLLHGCFAVQVLHFAQQTPAQQTPSHKYWRLYAHFRNGQVIDKRPIDVENGKILTFIGSANAKIARNVRS